MKEVFVEICKGKVIMEDVDCFLKDVNYFGVMLVKFGLVDGMVLGVIYLIVDIVCFVF